MAVSGPAVTVENEPGFAILRLHGRHGNAINEDLLSGLEAALEQARSATNQRGLLLASGQRLFSPGLDLQELVLLDRPAMDSFMSRFNGLLHDLFTFPGPVVAAVAGHAVAGGCVLALTADWRVLAAGAQIGLNEVMVGVPLPLGVSTLLQASVGAAALAEIALLGNNFRDQEATRAGLAHEICAASEVEAQGRRRMAEFLARDGRALAATKQDMRATAAQRMRSEDAGRRGEFLDCWFSDSTRRRISAVVDSLARRP